jgi:hypothetical protein
MSVSYYTNTVVGIRLSSDLKIKTQSYKTKETRYNTKTGTPYEIDVTKTTTTYGNLVLPGDLKESLMYFSEDGRDILKNEDEDYVKLSGEVPSFFSGNTSGEMLANGILGYAVTSISDYTTISEIDLQKVAAKAQKLKEWLKDTLGVDCQIKLYSIMDISA